MSTQLPYAPPTKCLAHFEPLLDVDIGATIGLGCGIAFSNTTHTIQTDSEPVGGLLRTVRYAGQTIGILDSGLLPSGPSVWTEERPKLNSLPPGTEAVVACGLAVAFGSFGSEGRIVSVTDHVNTLGDSPLIGAVGCFPDMFDIYPKSLREIADSVAAEQSLALSEAVYVACPDPMHPPEGMEVLDRCVFGSGIAPIALAAARESIPVLGLVMITGSCGGVSPHEAEGREKKTRFERFSRFSLDCAARISQQLTRIK